MKLKNLSKEDKDQLNEEEEFHGDDLPWSVLASDYAEFFIAELERLNDETKD